MKILFTGGGTGGHLFPIIAIIREIKRLSDNKSIELHYIGPQDKTGKFLLSQENVVIHPIAAGKLRRYFALENITDVLFNIPLGFFQSFFILLFNRPDVIFSKGGSGSVVVTIAASILGIPVFLHESDMSPGLSNKVTSHFAKKIFTAFSKTEYFNPSKTLVVGQPILKELLEGDENAARELFHLTLEKPILLVWGGSQGAQPVNDFILNILNQLIQKYEIIHVCGRGNHQETDEQSKVILDTNLQKYYHLWEFLEEAPLKHALKVCHFVISRAGSGSIFEIAAAGKPAIIIPLPSAAHNHQSKNAYAYAQSGAAIVMEQNTLSPNIFSQKLDYIMSHPEEVKVMQEKALAFAKPLAAKAIARELLEFLQK